MLFRRLTWRCLVRYCSSQSERQVPRHTKALKKKKPFGGGGLVLLTLPAAAFALGTWQVQRWRWKLGLIADMEERTRTPAVPLPEDLDELPKLEYKKVTVRGTFDHSREMLIGPRSNVQTEYSGSGLFQGSSNAGVYVVTPFKLADRDMTILVNRGWVPGNYTKGGKRIKGQTEGEVTITGVVRMNEKRNQFMPKADPKNIGYWMYRDVDAMAEAANAAPIFIDADLDSTVTGGPLGGQTRVSLRNDHFSYILTWYSLSAITFWMWYRRYRRTPPPDSAFDYLRKP
ncbi:surfeit locus protein 1-like [Gigantopelta aegis]|uniref:surfeit locus protein 1-like n=1 Tax=Gigantopelta aegis TaxID=1735272 RepID=UPI001B88AA8D|nr:surfeit locus protein 1-like [Gigantopelta aegis]